MDTLQSLGRCNRRIETGELQHSERCNNWNGATIGTVQHKKNVSPLHRRSSFFKDMTGRGPHSIQRSAPVNIPAPPMANQAKFIQSSSIGTVNKVTKVDEFYRAYHAGDLTETQYNVLKAFVVHHHEGPTPKWLPCTVQVAHFPNDTKHTFITLSEADLPYWTLFFSTYIEGDAQQVLEAAGLTHCFKTLKGQGVIRLTVPKKLWGGEGVPTYYEGLPANVLTVPDFYTGYKDLRSGKVLHGMYLSLVDIVPQCTPNQMEMLETGQAPLEDYTGLDTADRVQAMLMHEGMPPFPGFTNATGYIPTPTNGTTEIVPTKANPNPWELVTKGVKY